MARPQFDGTQLPALAGRTFVVTGANSGIGLEATRTLAMAGAEIVLACRNEAKAHAAMDDVLRDVSGARLEFMPLDLASLESIRNFAESLLAKRPTIDVLINNAGVMALPYRTTVDGFEMQFGTNHLGHYALTGLLLPGLMKSSGARVITVSSEAHRMSGFDLDDLSNPAAYHPWRAYARSKLANLLFAFELSRRARSVEAALLSAACHPGYASTNLQSVGPRMVGSNFLERAAVAINWAAAMPAAKGALSTLYAAVSDDVQPADYVGPGGLLRLWGYPERSRARRLAYDERLANDLWDLSAELTGVRFPI